MTKDHWRNLHEASPHRGGKVLKIAGWTLVGITLAAAFALVFGLAVKWLWNGLIPPIFGLGTITYWQAVGILLLSKLLFGAFRGHGQNRHPPFSRICGEERGDSAFFNGEKHPSPEEMRRQARHYRDFWRREGREAFEAYVRRVEKEPDDRPGE